MNRKLATLSLAAASLMFATVATSHEMSYVQQNPGVVVSVSGTDCGIGNNVVLNLSIGGVCFGSTPDQGWDNGNAGFTDPLTGLPAGSTDLQHLTPAGLELTSTLDITDSVFALTPGSYCQDLNDDVLCGGNSTGPAETEPGGNPAANCQAVHAEGAAGCTFRSEPSVTFCDTITIFGGLSGPLAQGSRRVRGVAPGTAGSGDWADPTLNNWDIDVEVIVFLSGVGQGNPVTTSSINTGTVPPTVNPSTNPCGAAAIGWDNQGTVSHS